MEEEEEKMESVVLGSGQVLHRRANGKSGNVEIFISDWLQHIGRDSKIVSMLPLVYGSAGIADIVLAITENINISPNSLASCRMAMIGSVGLYGGSKQM